jgi:hypothetical protein
LGVWLRQELTRRGYDLAKGGQSKFAREADIHPSMVNRGAEIDVLRRMGRALGYTLGEMLINAGLADHDELPARSPDELQASADNPYTDPRERQIWAWRELPERVRRQIILVLRAAVQSEAEEDRRPDADVKQFRKSS